MLKRIKTNLQQNCFVYNSSLFGDIKLKLSVDNSAVKAMLYKYESVEDDPSKQLI